MEIHAYAALAPGERLAPFTYAIPPLGPFDLLLKVTHCGLCHSDIHLIYDDWKRSKYPLVPGHEVVGTIVKKGADVHHLKIGQRVGVSWLHSSCMQCPTCLEGETNICALKTTTCNGHYGGFADQMTADSRFAYLIPDALDSGHAAPLLCAGATVYAPLRRHGITAAHSVAVIGIGGLGHLALQFAAAFGAEVTAISNSPDKKKEAKEFGAHHFITLASGIPSQFDFILSTVNADLDWNLVLSLLKPQGTLCFVGRPPNLGQLDIGALISFQKKVTGSSTANRAYMNEMLALAARKQIRAKIERFPLSEVNKAIERVKSNQVRYRAVLEM